MALKKEQHFIRGVQRDLSVSKFNPEYAFDAQNIRITAREHSTLLTVTNEKGNKKVDTLWWPQPIRGILLGHVVLNNFVVLFVKNDNPAATKPDEIWRVEDKVGYFSGFRLYRGNLNFSTDYPIECIAVQETQDIQKVYWVDGRNQLRVINIVAQDETTHKYTDTYFDASPTLLLNESVKVERSTIGNGVFAPGVIQYALTYYNKYGQESNIFYTSPLQYISFSDRGGSPEEKCSNSFVITIDNVDTSFDYVRIYSIHRSSIDAPPVVTNVADIATTTTITFIDTGTTGSSVDPTELLYVGGEDVIFGTIAQKDNTLFLGNFTLQRPTINQSIKDQVKQGQITYSNMGRGNSVKNIGYYPYRNSLYLGSVIKSFKYLEWYRFGVQFQYKTGKWSEPIWVNDAYNTTKPNYNGSLTTVVARYNIPQPVVEEAVSLGFIRARGVVVFPSLSDRECIAQGVLCPTVYNVKDRFSNSPFVQSSWFTRPNFAFDILTNISNWEGIESEDVLQSRAAVIGNQSGTYTIGGIERDIDVVNKGVWVEFQHNKPIPSNWKRNAEIQSIGYAMPSPFVQAQGAALIEEVSNNAESFFIDQSIVTFHSPDVEFDDSIQSLDNSALKLRIVGVVPITSTSADINIQASTAPKNTELGGPYYETVGTQNESFQGIKSLASGVYWVDKVVGEANAYKAERGFFTYAWHRNGPLNNETYVAEGSRTAMLDKKKLSNLKFSSRTEFLSSPWEAFKQGDDKHTGITPISIVNSEEQQIVRIPSPENSNLPSLNYLGNIDSVVIPTRNDQPYTISVGSTTQTYNKKNGYLIIATVADSKSKTPHEIFASQIAPLDQCPIGGWQNNPVLYGIDAVRMKYKSSPHVVFAFNYTTQGYQVVMPTTMEYHPSGNFPVNRVDVAPNPSSGLHFFWNQRAKEFINPTPVINDAVIQDHVNYVSTPNQNNYGYLFLAELYQDNISNRFGGQTEEAFESNSWKPAGSSVSLISGYNSDKTPIPRTDTVSVLYVEGDTYIQRYDHLKTYPYTLEDQNSVVDIISFVCETRINIDGRYDRNRGQTSNLVMTPTNFNKLNPVYSQENNFFTYRGLNSSKYYVNDFPNSVTWTKEKQAAALIDTWTNITLASTLDLDGDKGQIVSLNTFNNEIFCFQRQGLSNIIFNPRVQIPSSQNIPIEITNSGKVEGKRYLSNSIGCNNKWSIIETPAGIYFIDNITSSLYLFNGQVSSLSDKLGFRSWINDNNSLDNWDPINFNNFKSFYDKNNNDLYFVNKTQCLCYSELLQQFTSFMSYENVPAMFNVGSNFYAYKNNGIWQQFSGDYNMFFNSYRPYSLTMIANAEEPLDKIFNTLEFRADTWDGTTLLNNFTFDTLEVWNEYQYGTSTLSNPLGRPAPLKKKFRVWRANIPRDNKNKRDRIRNPWAYIKLSMQIQNTYRTEFHDAIIHYFA